MTYIRPTVPNLTDLASFLATPGPEGPINRMQIERSATGGGAGYANIGSITLVTGQIAGYELFDKDGVASSWYRWYPSNAANTFPATAGARDYSPEIQPGIDEGEGLIVSLGDVKQRIGIPATDIADDELLSQIIRAVGAALMGPTGRLFVRSPQSGTTTYYEDVACYGRTLRIPQGIAAASTLEVATSSQPPTGGTYTTVPTTEWFLRPATQKRDYGWPATQIVISDISGSAFYPGYNTVRWTGALGWGSVPPDISAVAAKAIILGWQSRQRGYAATVGSADFGAQLLREFAPESADLITWYSVISVG